MQKAFAIGTLFYPTLGIWASGLLKDTITYAAVGFIFYSTYRIINRKHLILNSIIIAISIYACINLKPYILYILIPSLLFWSQSKLFSKITNSQFKYISTPILLATFILGGYFFIKEISDEAGKYSLENVESIAKGFHSWHSHLAETRDQSGYTLGKVEFDAEGLLKVAPAAFYVTFFRPHPFEVTNFPTALESFQSNILLLLTLFVIYKVGLKNTLKLILKDQDVRPFLLFAILFGIAVGFTSYNFGALSRYKIPAIPFYTAALAIIYYKGRLQLLKQSN